MTNNGAEAPPKPMSKKRQAVWDKSGGLCWYCGMALPERGWQADHMEPIGRMPPNITYEYTEHEDGRLSRKKIEVKRPPTWPERDHIDNLVPSCQSCNNIKGMSDIEGFRTMISNFIGSLNRYNSQYRFAKRYGLIQEAEQPVVFWFERKEVSHDPT